MNIDFSVIDWSVIAAIIPASLADAVNPCAFAVMFILLGSILKKHGSVKRVIFSGLAFTLAVFISYSLMGLGLLQALASQGTEYTFWFKIIIGIIGVLIGLFNLKDFFWYGRGGFVMEVPKAWRPAMHKTAGMIQSPIGAFFIGIVLSLFLLPCTSGPYAVVMAYLASEGHTITGVTLFYVALYNTIFVIPMIIITFMVGLGYEKVEKLSKLRTRNVRNLHLIIGLLMLLLGAYVIYDAFSIMSFK
ncbi:MAG: hypothetical protein N4A38_01585 [Candidatus Gracilibacteria bacterium]|nr:hypothetical protein [Candidatus Gracilibacteria bacterium]